jgi:hypothetical protein
VTIAVPYDKVVVSSGHMVDEPGRAVPRFPPAAEARVGAALAAVLERWRIGHGDLAVTGGARGADIVVAELCLKRGADVWLLVPLPEEEFVARSVRLPGSDWERRFRELRHRCRTLFQQDELGWLPKGGSPFARNNRWLLAVGQAQAAPGKLHVLLVWDEKASGGGPFGTSHFAREAAALEAHLEIVNPTTVGISA